MTIVLVRNWWALALRGLFAILFGLIAFLLPGVTIAALVLLFAAYALVDGVFAIIAGLRAAQRHERWWPLALEGLVDFAVAVITFLMPAATAFALLFLVGFWAMFTGVLRIVAAVRLRKEIQGEWMLILNGILSVLFGVLLVALPVLGLVTLVWMIGLYALIRGVVLLGLAFRLRGHGVRLGGHPGTSTRLR
jgi:uncharacterized membrane protein HdeD (DUF308 family)